MKYELYPTYYCSLDNERKPSTRDAILGKYANSKWDTEEEAEAVAHMIRQLIKPVGDVFDESVQVEVVGIADLDDTKEKPWYRKPRGITHEASKDLRCDRCSSIIKANDRLRISTMIINGKKVPRYKECKLCLAWGR